LVAHKIEERQILDLDQYGLIVTTHRIIRYAKQQRGRPAEAVAVPLIVTKSSGSFFKKIVDTGKRRVVVFYYEEHFSRYDLSDDLIKVIEEQSLPVHETSYNDDGEQMEAAMGAYYITDAIPTGDASMLASTLNDAFRKARDIFRRQINTDKQQFRAQEQQVKDSLIHSLRSLKKL
jgi:hypothetical protein